MNIVRFGLLLSLIAMLATAALALDEPSAAECEAYYQFELRVIDEQRYYLTQAAVKAVEEQGPAPEDKARLIEAAKADVRERFEFDFGAAKRGRDRCLAQAR